jgi:hypothetical protein
MRSSEMKLMEGVSSMYDDAVTLGLRLAETPKGKGGWGEMFEDISDIQAIREQPGFSMKEEEVVATTALLLENEKRRLMAMDEDTRSLTVGGFQDMLFPVIRAGFATNPILDLVSVQPMTRRHGQVFYMDYVIGQTKGAYSAGQRMFDAFEGFAGGYHYSDEYVENEVIGTSAGASNVAYTHTCAYAANGGGGIRPGTIQIRGVDKNGVDQVLIRDDGNGGLIPITVGTSVLLGSSSVNYATGLVTLNFDTGDGFAAGAITISYEYDSEGSTNLPSIDVRMTTSPITATRRALRYRYSTEAQQDYAAEFNRNVDEEVAEGVANTIQTEQAREVLAECWLAAGAPFASFNVYHDSASAGYSRREHLGDMQIQINQTINQIYKETQRVRANWMVVDVAFANFLMALGAPYFTQWDQATLDDSTQGIKFLGTWRGSGNTVRVYVDALMDQFPGASPAGNALFGHKASQFQDVGYIFAPYRLLYVSPTTTLDDMVARKAMASRVGRKLVNARLFKRMELVSNPWS